MEFSISKYDCMNLISNNGILVKDYTSLESYSEHKEMKSDCASSFKKHMCNPKSTSDIFFFWGQNIFKNKLIGNKYFLFACQFIEVEHTRDIYTANSFVFGEKKLKELYLLNKTTLSSL